MGTFSCSVSEMCEITSVCQQFCGRGCVFVCVGVGVYVCWGGSLNNDNPGQIVRMLNV